MGSIFRYKLLVRRKFCWYWCHYQTHSKDVASQMMSTDNKLCTKSVTNLLKSILTGIQKSKLISIKRLKEETEISIG